MGSWGSTGTPRVVAPVSVVARVLDVPLLLVSVEIWSTQVFLHLDAAETERTRQLDQEHLEAMTEAARARREAVEAGRPGPSPTFFDKFADLDFRITDDVGTEYRPVSRSSGGTGTTWRLQASFRPGPPEEATGLVIEIAHSPAPTERYTIDLT